MAERGLHAIVLRLRERLPELEAAVIIRVHAIADPRKVAGVPLDTVLRRYVSGNAVLGDFLVEEAECAEAPTSVLRRLLRRQATLLDRLPGAVSEEHVREAKSWPSSSAERRRECVKSLLAGEQIDHAELDYGLDGHHLALMAKGEGAPEAMRQLSKTLDRRLLAVCREEESIWALLARGQPPARCPTGAAGAGRDPAGPCGRDRRRARRGAGGLAPQSPPGQGGAADRRAPR